jgi:hypothetical protein
MDGDVDEWLEPLEVKLSEDRKKPHKKSKKKGDPSDTKDAEEEKEEVEGGKVSDLIRWMTLSKDERRQEMEKWILSAIHEYEETKGHKYTDEEISEYLQFEPEWEVVS